jgi:hypothetical protein
VWERNDEIALERLTGANVAFGDAVLPSFLPDGRGIP